jgi:hypothetical protein
VSCFRLNAQVKYHGNTVKYSVITTNTSHTQFSILMTRVRKRRGSSFHDIARVLFPHILDILYFVKAKVSLSEQDRLMESLLPNFALSVALTIHWNVVVYPPGNF